MSSGIRAHLPGEVLALCAAFRDKGARVWVVGGGVRDLLIGQEAVDFDLATDAEPKHVTEMFPRTVPTGIAHGTITVLFRKRSYEVTTLRGETGYADGRRPDRVEYVNDIVADLARRDFTVNAIAYDPEHDELIDPFGGLDDIEARTLRAVGDPLERFREDGLRILRGARFTSTLGFDLHPETEAAFGSALDVYVRVSRERIRDEWLKAFKSTRPSRAFEVMARTGILRATSETLGRFAEDRPERFEAALRAMDACPPDPSLRLAALLAESAPASAERSSAQASAEFATELVHELRGTREERARIPRWIEGAASLPGADDAVAVRQFLRRLGREDVGPALTLAESGAEAADRETVLAVREAVQRELDAGAPVEIRDLAIKGGDLIRGLGSGPGKHVGVILSMLLDAVTLDPQKNHPEALLALARELEPRAREIAAR